MFWVLIIVSVIITLVEGIPLITKKLYKDLSSVLFLIISVILLGMAKILWKSSVMHILGDLLYPIGRKVFRYD